MRPAWSPDGTQHRLHEQPRPHYQIYVMKADGSDVRRVTTNQERDDYAAWHPDGKRLAFVSERSGKFDLYLVELPS